MIILQPYWTLTLGQMEVITVPRNSIDIKTPQNTILWQCFKTCLKSNALHTFIPYFCIFLDLYCDDTERKMPCFGLVSFTSCQRLFDWNLEVY